mmetsp:Transcript_55598/g.64972  ORF Transcript_55598/g.64972 Transcript_55598/m.64972 type:complete len:355 (-) Transcript_55598:650-1714(-)
MIVIKTAMLGLGTVNKNLLKIIANKKSRLSEEYGIIFKIVAATDSSGIAINEDGFDMIALVEHKKAHGRICELPSFKGAGRKRVQDILNSADVDLFFEATPCCVGTPGAAPTITEDSEALSICRAALTRGVSVVLANKGPLVHAIGELRELAQKNSGSSKGRLEYSATVCGGLPILNIGKRDMIAGNITKLQGVFNGTSNFIIDAMAKGETLQNAIKEAQNIGAAEADPSLDTGGWDTAFKLLIIANTIMKSDITLADISVEGIDDITALTISNEAKKGNVIKLVATADMEHGKFSVQPIAQSMGSFLGSITGWEMGVEIHSDIYGITYHKLYEKEPIPTAASMLRDAVNIFKL